MAKVLTRQRGNTWQYRFEVAKVDNKRKYISKGGFKTQKEAYSTGIAAKNEYDNCGRNVAFDILCHFKCTIHLNCSTIKLINIRR